MAELLTEMVACKVCQDARLVEYEGTAYPCPACGRYFHDVEGKVFGKRDKRYGRFYSEEEYVAWRNSRIPPFGPPAPEYEAGQDKAVLKEAFYRGIPVETRRGTGRGHEEAGRDAERHRGHRTPDRGGDDPRGDDSRDERASDGVAARPGGVGDEGDGPEAPE